MSIDLTLGFTEIPKDLDKTLASLGFTRAPPRPVYTNNALKMDAYAFFDVQRSTRGVHVVYWEGGDGEYWNGVVADPTAFMASASVTTYMRRSPFDIDKQMHVAKYLRDHYKAVLYDPQSDKLITD